MTCFAVASYIRNIGWHNHSEKKPTISIIFPEYDFISGFQVNRIYMTEQ